MSERQDSKQAEKKYLGRTGGSAWEREKPFSPPGDDTLDDSLNLLHDFAVAAQLLEPSRDDRIVDLGAGGGWCSDLLQRLNRTSIAVDISLDMLRVGRTRGTPTPIKAVAGDFEHLPFRDGSFDKAICLNALHHVPDMAAAVREIFRVLSSRGVAVFAEPGAGHAVAPASVAASRDFGVLEQEVLIEPLIETCRAAGFADVRVCPIAYVIPEFELSLDEWRAWKRLPRTKRPFRAMKKMWRAMLEFVGAGKGSGLFEEAFAMRLVRLLQHPVEEHPFILAAKQKGPRPRRGTYRATIQVETLQPEGTPGETVIASVSVVNTGSADWHAHTESGTGSVRLGTQLLDSQSRVISRDLARGDLGATVHPGESRIVRTSFIAPAEPGDYGLKFDLVSEGVTWFEPTGSTVEVRPFRVVRGTYHATIQVETLQPEGTPGETVIASVTVTNAGSAIWHARTESGTGYVRLGIQLLDNQSRVISRDLARGDLGATVHPGESRIVRTSFRAPAEPGEYGLKFDLVCEDVTWFEPTGSTVEVRPFRVVPGTYRAMIQVETLQPEGTPGETVIASVSVRNAGSATWHAHTESGTGSVRLGIQLLDNQSRVISRDFARGDLGATVHPGESRIIRTPFRAPAEPGDYGLKFDLVSEGVIWFEPTGSTVEVRSFRVVRP